MIVLDTSFLVAFHNLGDVHHAAAREVMSRFLDGEWGDGLLLEYVFLEVVTVLQARLDLHAALDVGDRLLSAKELTFVPSSEAFLSSLDTFRGQGGRGLSFADAAVATIARRHHPGYLATFDRAFRGLEGITPVP